MKKNSIFSEHRKTMEEMQMNFFTLKFSADTEKKFIDNYSNVSIPILRSSLILGVFLYASFAFLDLVLIPDILQKTIIIRLFGVIPIVLTLYLLSYSKNFKKWWQLAAVISVITAGAGIILIIDFAPYYGKVFYYVGIILVLILNYLMTKIRFVYASLTGLLLIIAYFLVLIQSKDIPKEFIINNLFFLVSANILGMFGSYFLEYYSRQTFKLNEMLETKFSELQELNQTLDRKVLERTEKITESEEKFRKAFNSSRDSVNITRMSDGLIVDVNSSFESITGYSREDALGKKISDLGLWVNHTDSKFLANAIKENGYIENFEFLLKRKNHKVLYSTISASTFMINNEAHIISNIRDINDIKLADIKLKESAKFWENTFRTTGDAIMILDKDQNILNANQTLLDIYNTTLEVIIGVKGWELMQKLSYNIEQHPFEKLKNPTKRETLEMWIEDRFFRVNINPIFDDFGILNGAVYVMTDISEIKKVERDVKNLNTELEIRVKERTAELEKTLSQVEQMNELFVDREFRIKELKEELKAIKSKR